MAISLPHLTVLVLSISILFNIYIYTYMCTSVCVSGNVYEYTAYVRMDIWAHKDAIISGIPTCNYCPRDICSTHIHTYILCTPAPPKNRKKNKKNMCKAHTKDKFRFRQVHLQILCWKRVKVTQKPRKSSHSPVFPYFQLCLQLPAHCLCTFLCICA